MIANTIKYRFEKQGKFGLLIQTWMLACTLASIVSTMRDGKLGSLVPIAGRAYRCHTLTSKNTRRRRGGVS
jgi:hypothetical protein